MNSGGGNNRAIELFLLASKIHLRTLFTVTPQFLSMPYQVFRSMKTIAKAVVSTNNTQTLSHYPDARRFDLDHTPAQVQVAGSKL